MPKILKGVFKKTFYNPNVRVSPSYSIVENLAQTPCVMLALEVLQRFPSQHDALLASIGSMESMIFVAKFNLSDLKPRLPYHVAFSIDVDHVEKTIG